MNANFILLHGKDSNRVYRVNVNLITKYESPEQVDNLINGNTPVTISPDLP